MNAGDHPADLLAIAKAFQRRGDFAAAEAAYEQIMASEPDNAEALNNLGNVQEIGQAEAACDGFAHAVDCDATLIEAYFNLIDTSAGPPEDRHIGQLQALAGRSDAHLGPLIEALRPAGRAYRTLERP